MLRKLRHKLCRNQQSHEKTKPAETIELLFSIFNITVFHIINNVIFTDPNQVARDTLPIPEISLLPVSRTLWCDSSRQYEPTRVQ